LVEPQFIDDDIRPEAIRLLLEHHGWLQPRMSESVMAALVGVEEQSSLRREPRQNSRVVEDDGSPFTTVAMATSLMESSLTESTG
jgi:hypothetical protein